MPVTGEDLERGFRALVMENDHDPSQCNHSRLWAAVRPMSAIQNVAERYLEADSAHKPAAAARHGRIALADVDAKR